MEVIEFGSHKTDENNWKRLNVVCFNPVSSSQPQIFIIKMNIF